MTSLPFAQAAVPPRPRDLPPERLEKVAATLADALITTCNLKADGRDQIIADLLAHAVPFVDGYQFARALEEQAGWRCTMEIAEVLDEWGGRVHAALHDMQVEWAAAHRIAPPFPVGTKVRVPLLGESGEIADIYDPFAAKYLLKIDRPNATFHTRPRRIVGFEDVQLIEDAA